MSDLRANIKRSYFTIQDEVEKDERDQKRIFQRDFREKWEEIPEKWVLEKSCVFWENAEAGDCYYSCQKDLIACLRSKGYGVTDEGHVSPKTSNEIERLSRDLLDMKDQEKTMFDSIRKRTNFNKLVNLCKNFCTSEMDIPLCIRQALLEYRRFYLDSSDIPWFYHVLAQYFGHSELLETIDNYRENYQEFLKQQEDLLLEEIHEQLKNRECTPSKGIIELDLTMEYRGPTTISLDVISIDVDTEESKVIITEIKSED